MRCLSGVWHKHLLVLLTALPLYRGHNPDDDAVPGPTPAFLLCLAPDSKCTPAYLDRGSQNKFVSLLLLHTAGVEEDLCSQLTLECMIGSLEPFELKPRKSSA